MLRLECVENLTNLDWVVIGRFDPLTRCVAVVDSPSGPGVEAGLFS